MILFDFIFYVSGSVLFVSFVGYFYADHKKEQISNQRGRELSPEEVESTRGLNVHYDDEGNPEPVYAKTSEQIKWDLYESLFLKGLIWSLGIFILMSLIGHKLGIIELMDRPLDDRY